MFLPSDHRIDARQDMSANGYECELIRRRSSLWVVGTYSTLLAYVATNDQQHRLDYSALRLSETACCNCLLFFHERTVLSLAKNEPTITNKPGPSLDPCGNACA